MDELKSFIDLPNFFSLFIKNHTYVTFLFEVASGMPDDPASTRNWEEEEVNSSRFIYKILSDIFKFDRSKELRDMEKYEDFC
jgi:ubiquitin-activating enzyme E1